MQKKHDWSYQWEFSLPFFTPKGIEPKNESKYESGIVWALIPHSALFNPLTLCDMPDLRLRIVYGDMQNYLMLIYTKALDLQD